MMVWVGDGLVGVVGIRVVNWKWEMEWICHVGNMCGQVVDWRDWVMGSDAAHGLAVWLAHGHAAGWPHQKKSVAHGLAV